MPESIGGRIKHAWNAFRNPDAGSYSGGANTYMPSRSLRYYSDERSLTSSIYTRIAIDISTIGIHHVRQDENKRYIETINSSLEECLTVSANVDQTGRVLMQDVVRTLFDEGAAAIVPVDTDLNPTKTGSYDIRSLRVGKITDWHTEAVTISLYNQATGSRENIVLPKKVVAIVYNPLYSIMNEPNSTLQRLKRKLHLLDKVDEEMRAGKLDIIIQLPYAIKSSAQEQQADKRRKSIEMQLTGSQHGIAYIDGTEKVTQLNRPAENNLAEQIDGLTSKLYSQLGLSEGVFNGTADEKEMLNYQNRTIEPVLTAITESMHRTFLTKTARTQGHAIQFIRDPFRLVPMSQLAEMADKFTRNEIVSSNEFRSILGLMPSDDPEADELRNKNLNKPAALAIPGQAPMGGLQSLEARPDEQQIDKVEEGGN